MILTGGQCLTALGSPISNLTTNWIHAHKRTNLPTLAYIRCIKTKYNTYLLGTEDVLDIYNRLLRSPHTTVPARSGKESALLIFVLGLGEAPAGGEG